MMLTKQKGQILNKILRFGRRKQYNHLPKSYKLMFAEGVFEKIKYLKGWKTNADAAKETGYTRQYISMVRRGVVTITTDFLIRMLEVTGNLHNPCWSRMFKVVPRGEYNPNHQMWNQGKFQGQKAYKEDSLSGAFRSKDHDIS